MTRTAMDEEETRMEVEEEEQGGGWGGPELPHSTTRHVCPDRLPSRGGWEPYFHSSGGEVGECRVEWDKGM